MKVFIASSKSFYGEIKRVKEELESMGHDITLPNSYDDPLSEAKIKSYGKERHSEWKAGMFRLQNEKIGRCDAILVLNLKKGDQEGYIGGSVLLEMFRAWELGKKIYLYNPIPKNMLEDEIEGLSPIVINRDLSMVKQ